MKPVYKSLASIAIWILFIIGLLALLMAFIRILVGALGAQAPDLEMMTAYFGYGVSCLFLSVVSILIAKKLE